jgi:Zn-dependent protease with chaperone function
MALITQAEVEAFSAKTKAFAGHLRQSGLLAWNWSVTYLTGLNPITAVLFQLYVLGVQCLRRHEMGRVDLFGLSEKIQLRPVWEGVIPRLSSVVILVKPRSSGGLLRYVFNQSREMGLHERGIIGRISRVAIEPGVNEEFVETDSSPWEGLQRVRLPPSLFYTQEYDLLQPVEERKRRARLRSNPAHAEFAAMQGMVMIDENSALKKEFLGFFVLILTKVLMDALLGGSDQTSLIYVYASGITAKFLADLVKAFYHRQLVYRTDQRALAIAGNKAAAVMCLRLLRREHPKPSLVTQVISFLQFKRIEPSLTDRIQALDPLGEYQNVPLPTVTVDDSPVDLTKVTEGLSRLWYVKLLTAIFIHAPSKFSLLRKLATWGVMGMSPKLSLLITLPVVVQILFPYSIEQYRQQSGGSNAQITGPHLQTFLDGVARQMGISKPVHLCLSPHQASFAEARGVHVGPGEAMVTTDTRFLGLPREQQEFLMGHELAHIHHNDTLTLSMIYFGSLLAINFMLNSTLETPLISGIIADLIATCLLFTCSRFIESRADKTAVRMSSNPPEVTRGGIDFFRNAQRDNLDSGLLTITAAGDNLMDHGHPSLSRRIGDLQTLKY